MGAFVAGWLAGQAIITYRAIRDQHGPPWPGQMLAATGLYAILAMLAEFGPGARRLAVMLCWGMNIAAFLNLYNISYLPGKQASQDWWKTVATPPKSGGTSWILPGGGCKTSSSSSGGSSSGGAEVPPPSGIPPNAATGKCPPGYTYAYGKCWSPAVNPVPPSGAGVT